MYYVIKEKIDEKGNKLVPEICESASYIAEALFLFINKCKYDIKNEWGANNDIKVIDINDLSQVVEPLIDSVLVYRIVNHPHTLYVYQRKTRVVKGLVWGETTNTEFKQTYVYHLVEYSKDKEDSEKSNDIEMKLYRKSTSLIDMTNVINEIKTHKLFIKNIQ